MVKGASNLPPGPTAPVLAPEDELGGLSILIDPCVRSVRAALREDEPIRPKVSGAELEAAFPEELPEHGTPLEHLFTELSTFARRFARRNGDPGFFGFVCSPGLPTDPLAHAVTAALNQNVAGFLSAPGAAALEHVVLRWFSRVIGLPSSAEGVFVSGGSHGNFSALACAVYAKAESDALENGLGGQRLVVYASGEAHFSVERSVRLLGLGSKALRKIPCDSAFRLSVPALEEAIREDAAAGNTPCAVVATAGSTAVGAIDLLPAIADVAEAHGLWLHVDAAYGGGALLAPELRARLSGIERADSVVIDLHKWFYLALDASMIFLRDPSRSRGVFDMHSNYVAVPRETPRSEPIFLRSGLETSRRFRALPAYVALRAYGWRRLAANMTFNARCARYLADLVKAEPRLQLITEPELSICCFRYFRPDLDDSALDEVNELVREKLEHDGRFYLSPTRVGGRTVLRVCILSFETRPAHLRELLRQVVKLGDSFSAACAGGN